MSNRVKLLAIFIFLAFIMKAVGEFVHEVVGHGFFVLLFGGEIIRVHISLFWPYKLSSIGFREPKGGFEVWQNTLIDGGGILACLIVSFMLQALLIFKIVRDRRFSYPLFWLSFWTFLNPAGYLILGGIKPFGDVAALIAEGVLTQVASIAIGLIIFFVAFLSISKILGDLLLNTNIVRNFRDLQISLSIFWLLIPLTATMALIGLRFLNAYLLYLPISFIPSILAPIIPRFNYFQMKIGNN